MSETKVKAGAQAPALTDDEALLAAMRNLWPILSPEGRRAAMKTAEDIKGKGLDENHHRQIQFPVQGRRNRRDSAHQR